MKSLVVLNPNSFAIKKAKGVTYINFGNLEIPFGLIELDEPTFDLNDKKNDDYVLVKVDAFSCNYRDKAILVNNFLQILNLNRPFLPFGSEFVATVIQKGKDVTDFSIGDKVISDCTYIGLDNDAKEEIIPGVVTNFASLGFLRIRKEKLIKQPKFLNTFEATSFSLGAQTALSMIRRSGVLEAQNPKVLVFSARSVTSLYIIQVLRSFEIEPICCSSTIWEERDLEKMDINKIHLPRELFELQNTITHVFDPFFDINILPAIQSLEIGGKYIFCGMYNQHPLLSDKNFDTTSCISKEALAFAIIKNISLIGNCLGNKQDLFEVIKLYKARKLKPIIDSTYSMQDSQAFIEKSFLDTGKFGKCVMKYCK